MNWSEQAWKSIDPILDEIRQHPFITEMADGTLSPAKFAKYLAQDKLYLANYGREMKALAAMLPDGELGDLYRRFAEDSMAAEHDLHAELSKMGYEPADTEPLPITLAYTRYTSGIIAGGDLSLSMAAMLPCMWVYNEVGKYILSIAKLENNPYRSWIECYSSEMMDDGARHSVEMTDSLADSETEERRKELVKIVRKKAEEAKVAIRAIRREANETIKKDCKDGNITEDDQKKLEEKAQKATDAAIKDVDRICGEKEKELLEV